MTVQGSRSTSVKVTWLDEGRQPLRPPNPAYPNGVEVDCSGGTKVTCTLGLPYPAKGCGQYLVVCETCGLTIIITAAGQADDPRSVKVACKAAGNA